MEWSVFWSAVSAVFTGLTVLIAVWAMFRWRKQEELKAKLNFKMAVANYSFQLTQMPETLNNPVVRHANLDSTKRLNELLAACNNAWMICEGLLDDNAEVKENWSFIFNHNKLYFSGDLDSAILGQACIGILQNKFVFD